MFSWYCVFQSRGLLTQVHEIVMPPSRISFGSSHVKGQRGDDWNWNLQTLLNYFFFFFLNGTELLKEHLLLPRSVTAVSLSRVDVRWDVAGLRCCLWHENCCGWNCCVCWAWSRCSCWEYGGCWLLFPWIVVENLPAVNEMHCHRITCQPHCLQSAFLKGGIWCESAQCLRWCLPG